MVFEIDRGGDETPKKMRFTDKNGNALDQKSLQKLPQEDRNVRFLTALKDEHFTVAMKYYDAGVSFPAEAHLICLIKTFQASQIPTSEDFKGFQLKLIDDYYKKQGREDSRLIETLVMGDHRETLSYIKENHSFSDDGLATYYTMAAMTSNAGILQTIDKDPNARNIINSNQILRTAIKSESSNQILHILCRNGAVLTSDTIFAAIERGDKSDVLARCLDYGATIKPLKQQSMTLLLTLARIKSPNQVLKNMLHHWPLKNVTNSVFRAITYRLERNDICYSENSIFMRQCIHQELSRRGTIKAFNAYLQLHSVSSEKKKIQQIGKIFDGLTRSRHPSIGPVTYKSLKNTTVSGNKSASPRK